MIYVWRFRDRIFESIIVALSILADDLHSCRHAVATHVVQMGMKAHDVACDLAEDVRGNRRRSISTS